MCCSHWAVNLHKRFGFSMLLKEIRKSSVRKIQWNDELSEVKAEYTCLKLELFCYLCILKSFSFTKWVWIENVQSFHLNENRRNFFNFPNFSFILFNRTNSLNGFGRKVLHLRGLLNLIDNSANMHNSNILFIIPDI